MTQILCMGASTVYGVGGPNGGWADMIKLDLHGQMYSADRGDSDAHEVYIFAKPDATVEFILHGHDKYIADYRREGRKSIVVLSIGLNNAKAIDSPTGYVSLPTDYAATMEQLLSQLSQKVDAIICVGFTPVDETKTAPKLNPFTNKYSYFINQRIQEFNGVFEQTAKAAGEHVRFVDLFAAATSMNWTTDYVSDDGLHPNDTGHRWIYGQVMPIIAELSAR